MAIAILKERFENALSVYFCLIIIHDFKWLCLMWVALGEIAQGPGK